LLVLLLLLLLLLGVWKAQESSVFFRWPKPKAPVRELPGTWREVWRAVKT
jgi:hypothetical protein